MVKIDLHVHTCYSRDGWMNVEKLYVTARRRGLNGLAVTDHNTIKGALELVKIVPPDFKVIVGEEIRAKEGEVTALFLKEEIPGNLGIEETIKLIKEQGGLAGVPHPFGSFRRSRICKDVLHIIIGQVDFIEIFNARNLFPQDDWKALKVAKEQGLAETAGSDAHFSSEVGRAFVEMDNFKTPEEFIRNLRSARLFIKRSPPWVHVATKWVKMRGQCRTV